MSSFNFKTPTAPSSKLRNHRLIKNKMGSVEEDDLVQMVKDFIESDSSPPAADSDSSHLSNSHRIRFIALQEILGSRTQVEREVHERVLKYMVQNKREVKTSGDPLKKWLVMMLRMDGCFNASICHTSLVNSFGCLTGDYEYIDTVVTESTQNGNCSKKRVIVDTEFKSQFEVARPTQAYKHLIETLPPIFVGSEEKLNKIISLLCSGAKQSLREAGLHVPPWRTVSYMQSKWVSNREPRVSGRTKEEEDGRKIGNLNKLLVTPPDLLVIKPKRRGLGAGPSGSALSSQFSKLGINCC